MRYERPKSGQWVQPIRRGYKLACCDCMLVHKVNFRLAGTSRHRAIQFCVFLDARATAAMRRGWKGIRFRRPQRSARARRT